MNVQAGGVNLGGDCKVPFPDGGTEVSILIPRREYTHFWHRLLHDRTSDSIAKAVSRLPHANVTFVPYHFGTAEISQEERDGYHQAKHH